MKKLLLVVPFVLVAVIGVRRIVHILAPDESKIRATVEHMEEGYNGEDLALMLGDIADDWRHASTRLDKATLKRVFFQQFVLERTREGELVRSRVRVDHEGLLIEVDEPGTGARLIGEATFQRLVDGEYRDVWQVRVEGALEKRDADWVLVESRHESLRGRSLNSPPFD